MADQTKTQKLFYIADYFGNYYRLNENNELIASAGVNTAGVYRAGGPGADGAGKETQVLQEGSG